MANKVLIITCKTDSHPNSVINLLREKNIPFFRLNTEALVTDYKITWIHHPGSAPSFIIEDKCTGKTISENDIHAVWYRRPQLPEEMPYSVSKEIDAHNAEEARGFFTYLMYYLCEYYYSIGDHLYDKKAGSKLIQSKIAAEIGLTVSPTCFSNSANEICEFAKPFEEVVLKSIANFNVPKGDDYVYHLYATKVRSATLPSLPEEAFCQSFNFMQQYVDKAYELRITIMGKHIFACKLHSQDQDVDKGKIDWRQGYDYELKHEMVTLPRDIEDKCREYLRRFHLNFGCFDFIVTPEGEYVFLECNPNGQWGWIEDECGVPMSEALLECLIEKQTP